MKRRTKLVSNSSSSSFLIYGWGGEAKDLVQAIKDSGRNMASLKEYANKYYDGDVDKVTDKGLFEAIPHKGLRVIYGNPNDAWGDDGRTVFYGQSWDNVGVDETGGQFMTRIEAAVTKTLGEDAGASCGTVQDAWYDG